MLLYLVILPYFASFIVLLTDVDIDDVAWLYMAAFHLAFVFSVIWIKKIKPAKTLAINVFILMILFAAGSEIYRQTQNHDFRNKADVLDDIDGSVPALLPAMFIPSNDGRGKENVITTLPKIDDTTIFPLSGLPLRDNVYCQEDNGWYVFKSDRYGFNNPDVVWDNADNSILLIGDSFTQGACHAQNIPHHLRENLPDRNIINLGAGGSGPLIEYAQFREFTNHAKPSRVFWLIAGNDVTRTIKASSGKPLAIDFSRELLSPDLQQYLSQINHTQNYFDVYQDMVPSYEKMTQALIEQKLSGGSDRLMVLPKILSGYYTVNLLKSLLGSDNTAAELNWRNIPDAEVAQLQTLYRNIKSITTDMNIQITFVILPQKTGCYLKSKPAFYDTLKQMYDKIGFDYIDLWDDFNDACHLYFAKNGGHMNAEGYKAIASVLEQEIKTMNTEDK